MATSSCSPQDFVCLTPPRMEEVYSETEGSYQDIVPISTDKFAVIVNKNKVKICSFTHDSLVDKAYCNWAEFHV